MKEYTEKELKDKAERYCLAAERCPWEVRTKLLQWGASDDETARILEGLEKMRFIEVPRYCRAFVRDKYRFSGWGRMKIVQALRMKRIPECEITDALSEIEEEEYEDGLRELLCRKRRTLVARNDYERNAKLIRFAVGRGYALSEIMKYLNDDRFHEDMD